MKQKLLTEEYIFQESFPESLCLINQLSLGKKVKSINRVKWPTWVRITRSLVTSEAFVDDSNDNDGQDESTDHDDGEKLNGQSTVEDHTRSTTLLEHTKFFKANNFKNQNLTIIAICGYPSTIVELTTNASGVTRVLDILTKWEHL